MPGAWPGEWCCGHAMKVDCLAIRRSGLVGRLVRWGGGEKGERERERERGVWMDGWMGGWVDGWWGRGGVGCGGVRVGWGGEGREVEWGGEVHCGGGPLPAPS